MILQPNLRSRKSGCHSHKACPRVSSRSGNPERFRKDTLRGDLADREIADYALSEYNKVAKEYWHKKTEELKK